MRFVYPQFLWALLLLAIPIIIHLYNFRKYKTLYFSSLKFLKKVELENQATKNLKHLILLITRLLCLLFAILAFAQPYIPVNQKLREGGNPMLAIYIDNSFSMGQKGTEGELLSEAKESARRLINSASNDTRLLLVTNEMSGIEQRIISKVEAIDYLDKIELSPLVRKMGDVMDWQRTFIEQYSQDKEKISTVQYVLLSDFQKNSFDTKAIKEDEKGFYYPIQFVAQNNSNLCVDSAWFTEPNIKIGQNNELNVRVHNYGKTDYINAELNIRTESINRDVFVDVKAGQNAVTTINFMEARSKNSEETFRSASASIRDKQVYFDDEFFFSYAPKESAKVLIIDGPDAVPNVRVVYSLEPFYSAQSVSENGVTLDLFKGVDLVVLNGLNDISSGLAQQLKDFKTNQGSLLIFPGTAINTSSWNSAMSSFGLSNLRSSIADGTKIKEVAYNDPFFKTVFDKKPSELNMPSINKMYNLTVNAQYVPLLKAQNGQAVFVRTIDNKAFLFGSSLQKSFSAFTGNALFSTLCLRVAEMSHKQRPYFLTIGDESKYPLYTNINDEKPIHLKNASIDFIPIKERIGNLDYISIRGNEASERLKAGVFDILATNNLGKLALNYNRLESDIEPMNLDDAVTEWKDKGLSNITPGTIKNGQSLAKLDLEKPFEYWRWAIFLSLLFLILELVIIRWWKN
jgi:Aerotolerance regulator N-terminal